MHRELNGMPNVVVIIPARYASTRLPAKPLVDLCGKPMIRHVYERAARATLVRRVLVATDHPAIAAAVEAFGGEVIMTPEDVRSGSDRAALVALQLPEEEAGIVVNVQGDEPLIEPRMIDQAVRALIDDERAGVGTPVKAIASADELANPNVVKVVVDAEGYALYFSRSPIPYLRDGGEEAGVRGWHLRHRYLKHIGLYAYRRGTLLRFASWPQSALEQAEKLEQLRMLERGLRIRTVLTRDDSIPVDTPEDAERVRQIIGTLTATASPS